jgi:hypothetical protein
MQGGGLPAAVGQERKDEGAERATTHRQGVRVQMGTRENGEEWLRRWLSSPRAGEGQLHNAHLPHAMSTAMCQSGSNGYTRGLSAKNTACITSARPQQRGTTVGGAGPPRMRPVRAQTPTSRRGTAGRTRPVRAPPYKVQHSHDRSAGRASLAAPPPS